MILEYLFKDHPHSVGESYLEHQRHAFAFGGTMVLGGIACILHGLIPALFLTTGSLAVARLNDRMVLRRSTATATKQAQQETDTLLARQQS